MSVSVLISPRRLETMNPFHGIVVNKIDKSLQEAARVKLVILNHTMQVDDL